MAVKNWKNHSIVYVAYGEDWTPESIHTSGVGGSQTALIYLSRYWKSMGYEVTVYSGCEGTYDGVEYLPLEKFCPEDSFDTLILWRTPFDYLKKKLRAKKIFLDLHDLVRKEELRGDLSQIDRFFVKSRFHKEFFLHSEELSSLRLPEEKFTIIPNGIEVPENILIEKSKTPRIVYSSFYNRGLDLLLSTAWPIIKREVPKAELHIFYGWETYEARYGKDSFTSAVNFLMIQEGVHHHGRIPQPQLFAEKAKSHLHYYVSYFPEIDCISVRESIAMRCLPVLSEVGALKEKKHCLHIPGNPLERSTHEAAAYQCVELLRHPERIEPFLTHSDYETWSEVAKTWADYFE